MKRFFTIVGTIDRRIIFLLIGLSVLIPLIKPNWLKLPIKIDNNTQIVYDSISDLQEYGKTYFDIYKIDDETFLLDFCQLRFLKLCSQNDLPYL